MEFCNYFVKNSAKFFRNDKLSQFEIILTNKISNDTFRNVQKEQF